MSQTLELYQLPTDEVLAQAYRTLGLEPGIAYTQVSRKYKQLTDPTDEQKHAFTTIRNYVASLSPEQPAEEQQQQEPAPSNIAPENNKLKPKRDIGGNNQWGYVDEKDNSNWVIQPQFHNAWNFHQGLARVCFTNRFPDSGVTYGYINQIGTMVIPPFYGDVGDFSEERAKYRFSGGKWGYIDPTGKQVIPDQFDTAEDFYQERARVGLNGETFYIDKNGNRIE